MNRDEVHSANGDSGFDAFISYRRSDGRKAAAWLRKRLIEFPIPDEIVADRGKQSLELRVFRDRDYELATEDFFEKRIRPALQSSRFFVLVATPNALKRRPNGQQNWCQREIDEFLSVPENEGRILVARAAGEVGDALPEAIEQRYQRMDQIDILEAGEWQWPFSRRKTELEKSVAAIAGRLLALDVEKIPILVREAERLQQKRAKWWAIGLSVVFLLVLGFAVWALIERNNANFAALQAEERARQAEISKERSLAAQNYAEYQRVLARSGSESGADASELAAIAPKYQRQSENHQALAKSLVVQLDKWRARRGLSVLPPDSLFSLEALRAKNGNCFIVYFGTPKKPHLIIVDGGPAGVYRKVLEPRLSKLAGSRALTLDLVISTQSDDDKLRGLIDLMKGLIEGKGPRLDIRNVWSSVSLPPSLSSESRLLHWNKSALPVLASLLGIPVNRPFSHRVATSAAGAPRVSFGEGLSITVLGPPMHWIAEYDEWWMRELMRRGIADPDMIDAMREHHRKIESFASDQIELVPSPIKITRLPIPPPERPDESPTNLASFLLMVERAGHRMLLTSDARQDLILDALTRGGYTDDEGKLWVDLLVLPHSGSRSNVSVEFFRRVRADYYLISTNGAFFKHPHVETMQWLFEARQSDGVPFTIVLTYELEQFEHYNELKAVIGAARATGIKFELIAPTSEDTGVVVDLMLASDFYENQSAER